MKWQEVTTSVSAMVSILGILYLGIIDGLATETLIISILTVAGLGGYRVLQAWLKGRGR